ncbi:MAG: hypothetical protein MI974_03065 [Chitinophagales bacterium]|nr:hypothetical protein [Chitinophagales bacterium]
MKTIIISIAISFPLFLVSQEGTLSNKWDLIAEIPLDIQLRKNKILSLDSDGNGKEEFIFFPEEISETPNQVLKLLSLEFDNKPNIGNVLSVKWEATFSLPTEILLRENDILALDSDGNGKEEIIFFPKVSFGISTQNTKVIALELKTIDDTSPILEMIWSDNLSLTIDILTRNNMLLTLDSDGNNKEELVLFPDDFLTNPLVSLRLFSLELFDCNSIPGNQQDTDCPLDGALIFSSQADIDNFINDYPCCFDIDGDVVINGSDINNLEGLRNIHNINGDLDIRNCNLLSSLTGLENLKKVALNIEIKYNDALSDISAISKIEVIGQDLDIRRCPITNLPAFVNLNAINRSLILFETTSLTDISNLKDIEFIGDRVYIRKTALENLNGLQNLVTVGGDLRIEANTELESLQGLNNLELINSIKIFNNPMLSSLAGLEAVNFFRATSIQILGNNLLSQCDLTSLCSILESNSIGIEISDNLGGCTNKSTLIQDCENE